MDVQGFASQAESVLGDRLVALYQFGSSFARGPSANDARLLMMVSEIDTQLLEDVRPLAKQARQSNLQLRFDTKHDIMCSADVFPVFTLELIETKALVRGTDVLHDLAIHPEHLRQRLEQSLRSLHRDLLRAYVTTDDEWTLTAALRQCVSKSIYLLRALVMVCELDASEQLSVEALIETVIDHLLPNTDREVWHRMRRLASFEEATDSDQLVELFGQAHDAFAALVEAVDKL